MACIGIAEQRASCALDGTVRVIRVNLGRGTPGVRPISANIHLTASKRGSGHSSPSRTGNRMLTGHG